MGTAGKYMKYSHCDSIICTISPLKLMRLLFFIFFKRPGDGKAWRPLWWCEREPLPASASALSDWLHLLLTPRDTKTQKGMRWCGRRCCGVHRIGLMDLTKTQLSVVNLFNIGPIALLQPTIADVLRDEHWLHSSLGNDCLVRLLDRFERWNENTGLHDILTGTRISFGINKVLSN